LEQGIDLEFELNARDFFFFELNGRSSAFQLRREKRFMYRSKGPKLPKGLHDAPCDIGPSPS
jgi:hypothetical protein